MKLRLSSFDTPFDGIVEKYVLWMIPYTWKPNYFTYARFVSIPFVYYLLSTGHIVTGMTLFLLSAFTDLIDGALARSRDQITSLGKVIDPLADKLLMLAMLFYLGLHKPIVFLVAIYIMLEILTNIGGIIVSRLLGNVMGANTFGKIKMWFQVFGLLGYALGITLNSAVLIQVSTVMLAISLLLAILAGIEQFRKRILQFLK